MVCRGLHGVLIKWSNNGPLLGSVSLLSRGGGLLRSS